MRRGADTRAAVRRPFSSHHFRIMKRDLKMGRSRSLEANKRRFTLDLDMYDSDPRRFDWNGGIRRYPQEPKSIHWWRAQCSLRGLDFDVREGIPSLKYRLNERGEKYDETHECPILLKGPDDATWNQIISPEGQAEAGTRRMAFEAIQKEQLVVVRVDEHRCWTLKEFCKQYGWEYDSGTIMTNSIWANAPEGEDDYRGWVVFGPNREEVRARMHEIEEIYGPELVPQTPSSIGKRKRADSAGPAECGEESWSRSVKGTLKFEDNSHSPIPKIKLESTPIKVERL